VVFVGDRNTKYFHGFTTIRWRMNRHGMLKDGKGNWVSDPEELERIVTQFYRDLYTCDTIY